MGFMAAVNVSISVHNLIADCCGVQDIDDT